MKKKTQEQFISEAREANGDVYTYENAKYINDRSPVTVTCQLHGDWFPLAGNHLRGKAGCPKCAGNATMTSSEFVSKARAIHGDTYGYDKVIYRHSQHKIIIECRTHGEFAQIPNAHLRGQGCPKCANKGVLNTEIFIENARAIHGDRYDYSESVFVGTKVPIQIRCKVHNMVFEQVYDSHIHQKSGCPHCFGKRLKGMETFLLEAAGVHGDRYDYSRAVYTHKASKMSIVCEKHGEFLQRPADHIHQKQGCPRCAHSGPSKPQLAIAEFLSKFTSVRIDAPLQGRMTLDVMLDEHQLAVEFHGLLWHSTAFAVDPRKDFKKHKIAAAKGVRMLHIYEDEWEFNRGAVERTLMSAIGALQRIHARKCNLVFVDSPDANNFYMHNHVQGSVNSRLHIGLELENTLVACMSFDMLKSTRTNKDRGHWELTRYASTCTVVGGAGRLLKSFTTMGLANVLTSYSDTRLFSGRMYERLGFTLCHSTPPDYFYTTGRPKDGRMHKSGFQKKHLVRKFPGCDIENKTEKEICEENGLYQIYDCGKKRWDLVISTSN